MEELSLVMSLIKYKNRSEARTVPCGTPEITADVELFSPFTMTCYDFSVKKVCQSI